MKLGAKGPTAAAIGKQMAVDRKANEGKKRVKNGDTLRKWEAEVVFTPGRSSGKEPFESVVTVEASNLIGAIGRAARTAKKDAPKGVKWAQIRVLAYKSE